MTTYYTTKAIEYLGLQDHKRVVGKWLQQGKIKAQLIGGRIYAVQEKELDRVKGKIRWVNGRPYLPVDTPDGLINLSEAAKILECSRETASKRLKKNKVPIVETFGQAKFVKRDAVQALKEKENHDETATR